MIETFKVDSFEYQRTFIEWLTALNESSGAHSPVASFVKPQYRYRLDTYQSSYLGRITANLSDTLFEPCENLFGRDFVAQVLAGFFKAQPPTSASLTSAAEGLPELLRSGETSREALLFADLLELSQLRWKILIERDSPVQRAVQEDTALSDLHLIRSARLLLPSGVHDLSEAWTHAQNQQISNIPEVIFSEQRGVLLGKSSPLHFHVITVPNELEAFVKALVAGSSVEQAVEHLEQELLSRSISIEQTHVEAQLQNLLRVLTQLTFLIH